MGAILTVTPNSALDLWASVKHLRSGPKLRTDAPRLHPGGGGVNVSRVLHSLGGETFALFTAGGCTGEEIAAALDREGVPSRQIEIEGASRQSVNLREQDTGEVFRVVMPGPNLSKHEESDLLAQTADLAAGAPFVVGSGSLPPGTSAAFWADLSARVKRAGTKLVLDSASHVGPALKEGVWLLRENKDEIIELADRELDWPGEVADWASGQVEAGACEIAVVTHGAEGALMVTRDVRIRIAAPEVQVISAIGAGDSFVAGLCLALDRDEPVEVALRLGVAAAAATLLTPGTELCRKADVERLIAECGAPEYL